MLKPVEKDYDKVVAECRTMIAVGSKSFATAAKLFGKSDRDGAFLLYGWCRFCDDTIDNASSESELRLTEKLDWLIEQTEQAYGATPPEHPVFRALHYIVRQYAIPRHYPLELLEGMAMDVRRQTYATFEDLLLYCYRVAGTVGLMMSHVMQVSDERALKHASDLGIAMQLTNISRDILDDAAMGRVYLPLDWIRQEGFSPDTVGELPNREKLASLARRLIWRAETYYRSGDAGLKYLSLRPACAIAAARQVYSEIGVKVVRKGARAWDERVWISPARKVVIMIRGMGRMLQTLPGRFFRPWRATPIQLIWRHQNG